MVKEELRRIKGRAKGTHKGDYGHVLVIAGSVGLTGAAYLASMGALLSGSGLVTLGVPKSINAIMEEKLTEVMTLPLDETNEQTLDAACEEKILNFAAKVDVVAIGPGLSRNNKTQRLVQNLTAKLDKPIVLDADGINAFEGAADKLKGLKSGLVITPHPGELSRLIKKDVKTIQQNRVNTAKNVSKTYNCITVLKGAKTVVANPAGDVYINKTGNPGMATGGVGDILTGMIASFIGQGIVPYGAAKLAVHFHGRAGDLAMHEKGEISLIATDLLDKLPVVLKSL